MVDELCPVLLPHVRLHEHLQDCNASVILKPEGAAKAQRFIEWALKYNGFHSQCQENRSRCCRNPMQEVHLQLSAFKTFLKLARNNLTDEDFTEAFDAACFPLSLLSRSFDPG